MNEKEFDQNFEQITNHQIELIRQLKQKQERDSLWYNEDLQLHELENVISKLHNTTSSDKNNFRPKILASSGPNFRTCLVNLFNSCLTNSQWPSTESRVLFIKEPSKPDYTDPSAYRPLCMSSHFGKMFERILNNRIKTFLMKKNLIDHEQEGFLPKESTTRSLYRLKIEYEIRTRDKRKVALINLDLEKAFDSVWHNRLFLKLWTAGTRGLLFKLLSKFLTCRVVKTRLDNVTSHLFQPKQGVPQGSVLSPLLFIFYIADMLNNTAGIKFKHADDSQILLITDNQSTTCLTVEQNLNAVPNMEDPAEWHQDQNRAH